MWNFKRQNFSEKIPVILTCALFSKPQLKTRFWNAAFLKNISTVENCVKTLRLPISDFSWKLLNATTCTDAFNAFKELFCTVSARFPPICIFISKPCPTDSRRTYKLMRSKEIKKCFSILRFWTFAQKTKVSWQLNKTQMSFIISMQTMVKTYLSLSRRTWCWHPEFRSTHHLLPNNKAWASIHLTKFTKYVVLGICPNK